METAYTVPADLERLSNELVSKEIVTIQCAPNSILNIILPITAGKLIRADFSNCLKLTTISAKAFKECKQLQSVSFFGCSALSEIQEGAFDGCYRLQIVDFTNCKSIQLLGDYCFKDCSELINLKTEGLLVKKIGKQAFSNCIGLKYAKDVICKETQISDNVFIGCTNINPKQVPAETEGRFNELTSLGIPEKIIYKQFEGEGYQGPEEDNGSILIDETISDEFSGEAEETEEIEETVEDNSKDVPDNSSDEFSEETVEEDNSKDIPYETSNEFSEIIPFDSSETGEEHSYEPDESASSGETIKDSSIEFSEESSNEPVVDSSEIETKTPQDPETKTESETNTNEPESTDETNSEDEQKDGDLKPGAVGGIVFAVVVAVIAIVVLIVVCVCKHKKSEYTEF